MAVKLQKKKQMQCRIEKPGTVKGETGIIFREKFERKGKEGKLTEKRV